MVEFSYKIRHNKQFQIIEGLNGSSLISCRLAVQVVNLGHQEKDSVIDFIGCFQRLFFIFSFKEL